MRSTKVPSSRSRGPDGNGACPTVSRTDDRPGVRVPPANSAGTASENAVLGHAPSDERSVAGALAAAGHHVHRERRRRRRCPHRHAHRRLLLTNGATSGARGSPTLMRSSAIISRARRRPRRAPATRDRVPGSGIDAPEHVFEHNETESRSQAESEAFDRRENSSPPRRTHCARSKERSSLRCPGSTMRSFDPRRTCSASPAPTS